MRRNNLKIAFFLSLLVLDMCGLILAFQGAYWTRFQWVQFLDWFPPIKGIPEAGFYQQTLIALLPMCLVVFSYLGFYRDQMHSAYDEFVHVFRGMALCALVATAMSFAFRYVEYSRLVIGLWTFYGTVLLYLLRELDKWLFRQLMDRTAGPHHMLVIGKGRAIEAIQHMVPRQPFVRASYLDAVPSEEELSRWAHQKHVSEILMIQGSVPSAEILEIARWGEQNAVECQVVPDLLEMRRGEIIFNRFCGLPTFHIRPVSLYGTNYLLKRSFDVFVSLIILLVAAIPLAFVGLLICLDSRGPVLFTQDRMGLRGQKFKLYKFRTMVANADDYIEELKHKSDRSGPVFKMKNDPRITKVGKWLRRFSLDEIPQILNVLKGDMSLVGPRPQVLWEAAHYDDHARKRLRIMPGITGLWQVSGRAALSYEEMINLDIYYLENWSLGLDLKILLRTLPAIFAREGAY
jgi:exopolysaccharide biosynthesis polyprenyl glycosylphosphotransferase